MKNKILTITAMLAVMLAMTGIAVADSITGSLYPVNVIADPFNDGSTTCLIDPVLTFDDISLPPNTFQPVSLYTGVTFDNNWYVYNDQAYIFNLGSVSNPNYIFNGWGYQNLGFGFSSPVTFNGAYFMGPIWVSDMKVRFVGYREGIPTLYSPWLTLSKTQWQYLSADFPGVDRVVVESDQAGHFVIDNLKYNETTQVPEFPTVALPIMSVLGIMFLMSRKKHN